MKLSRLVTILSILFAGTLAYAQKPALVENIDEKGRVPYYDAAEQFFVDGPALRSLTFKTVPAGYRLVITHVSAAFAADPPGTPFQMSLFAFLNAGEFGQGNGAIAYKEYLPIPTTGGKGFYVISSPVTYYVEPGKTPSITISGVTQEDTSVSGTITGYLVSIN